MLISLSLHTRAILPKITNSHSLSSSSLIITSRRLQKSTPHLTSSISYNNNNNTNKIKYLSPFCCLFTPRNFRLFSSSMGSLSLSDEPLNYPTFRRDESVVDTYHGVPVPDPYRWLEDPDAEEVKEFVKKQVDLTESVLKKCETRGKLHEKLTKFYDYPKYGAPFREADKYFYLYNSGLQPQKVLYMQDSLDGEAEVLLDPNGLSDDGTISLNTYAVSEDAKYLAYALSSSGSDWVTVKVMQIEDKKVLPDTLSWVKFSGIGWTNDSKGFFYSRYPAPKEGENLDAGTETNVNLDHQLYYHYLGTDQSEDILCWENPDNPQHTLGASVTEDGKFVLLYINEDCDPVNKLYYCDLSTLPSGIKGCKEKKCLPFIRLIDNFEAMYRAIANDDTVFTFLTNKDAPKYKLVRVDLKEPSIWTEVIPQAENDVLDDAVAVNGNQLIVSYMSNCKHILQMRDLQSGSLLHQLPISIGSVDDVSARRKDSLFFIAFTSFLTPGTIYQCNLDRGVPDLKIFREIVVPGFDPTEFQVSQVFVPSKDGSTQIPMFVVARKDIVLDRSHPCLLYGYGGFNISLTPYFSVSRVVLMRHLGVVFCIANIRGGGEYGEEWHKDGSLAKKQNCFDDFISSAEYLVSSGYTQPKKLAIEGGSNGGLLVGACINQRPDLFGCALAHVGVMDMLRFHKFTIGHAWTSDYGCSDKEEDFQWLIKYSPLHNVRRPWEQSTDNSCQYPPTLLLTADHDDRVVPLHTLKLLATMQYVLCTSLENSPQTNPILGRIDVKAGHGAGRPTKKVIDEWADSYSFMAKVVGATWID